MAGYHTFVTAKAQAKIARVLAELENLPMTRDELQCLLRISKPTARRYIEHLRAEPRRLFIVRWRPTVGLPAPVYAVGNRKDAPMPPAMSREERNAKLWRAIKSDKDRHERVKAASRVFERIRRAKAKPQPWFAALLGINKSTMKEAA